MNTNKKAIMPTLREYEVLLDISKKLALLCPAGKKCEECFLDGRLGGESCCPVSHLGSIFEELQGEVIKLYLQQKAEVSE